MRLDSKENKEHKAKALINFISNLTGISVDMIMKNDKVAFEVDSYVCGDISFCELLEVLSSVYERDAK